MAQEHHSLFGQQRTGHQWRSRASGRQVRAACVQGAPRSQIQCPGRCRAVAGRIRDNRFLSANPWRATAASGPEWPASQCLRILLVGPCAGNQELALVHISHWKSIIVTFNQ
jgi:hypothetical protein